MISAKEAHEIALNVDRGDHSKLAAVIEQHNRMSAQLRHTADLLKYAATWIEEKFVRDALEDERQAILNLLSERLFDKV